ncbi:MAG: Swt1 family HEPN domain-containing protein [bacterium]
MARNITTSQRVFSNRCIGISKTLVDLDKVHNKNRMVRVIIDGLEYWLRHAADQTNRLSGITEVEHIFKKVKQFSYSYDGSKNAIMITLSEKQSTSESTSDKYYGQFPDDLRERGERISKYYIVLYCLENFIRDLITNTLERIHGKEWWELCVDENIRQDVSTTIDREKDAGVTLRSSQRIDYTTFGQLSIIINANWQDFESIFESKKAFNRIMLIFNALRGPIAHCCNLAKDEEDRLDLSIKDWFKRCLRK